MWLMVVGVCWKKLWYHPITDLGFAVCSTCLCICGVQYMFAVCSTCQYLCVCCVQYMPVFTLCSTCLCLLCAVHVCVFAVCSTCLCLLCAVHISVFAVHNTSVFAVRSTCLCLLCAVHVPDGWAGGGTTPQVNFCTHITRQPLQSVPQPDATQSNGQYWSRAAERASYVCPSSALYGACLPTVAWGWKSLA